MLRHHEIIEKYRQADFEHRLSLFLEYPSFRRSFIGIDQRENNSKSESPKKPTKVILGRIWKNNWIRGWLKE